MAIGHNADIVQVILKNAEGALDEAYNAMHKMYDLAVEINDEVNKENAVCQQAAQESACAI
ncbi:MAG: hypothetical protein LBI42_11600 [Chitinispirillales bacterium]|jgi:flagellin-like hook-associated protein FlgL|nr:hypothetical protein [Chitinispirillales bacterium]